MMKTGDNDTLTRPDGPPVHLPVPGEKRLAFRHTQGRGGGVERDTAS